MSAIQFKNSSYKQKNSTKQPLHNNENLGTLSTFCFTQFQHTAETLEEKGRAKINYKDPTGLETNSKKVLCETKTVNPEAKFPN